MDFVWILSPLPLILAQDLTENGGAIRGALCVEGHGRSRAERRCRGRWFGFGHDL